MTKHLKYAVVVNPSTMFELTSVGGLYGACLIDGDEASCIVCYSRDELNSLISGYDATPYGYSDNVAVISINMEAEALAQIADFAATLDLSNSASVQDVKSYLNGFTSYGSRYFSGLMVRTTSYGLEVKVSLSLAGELRWNEGDKICLSYSISNNLYAISISDQGIPLKRSVEELDYYEISNAFNSVPVSVSLVTTDWQTVEYHRVDDHLVFSSKMMNKVPSIVCQQNTMINNPNINSGSPIPSKNIELNTLLIGVLLLFIAWSAWLNFN